MESAKNVSADDSSKPTTSDQLCLQEKAKLVAKLWIAGLASTYGGCDNGLTGQNQKCPVPAHLTNLGPQPLSTTTSAVKHQLADIDEAVRLIRARTLEQRSSGGDAASLEELGTVMLGLCRLVADNAKQLVVSADKAEDELMKTKTVANNEDEELKMKKRKLNDDKDEDQEHEEEVETVADAPVKLKKRLLKIDKVSQLPPSKFSFTDDEDEEVLNGYNEKEGALREKKVPDFGLATKLAMADSGCCRCYCSGDDLSPSPGRQLPAKLVYLYKRKCCSANRSGLKTVTATTKTARRRRSMTCDSGSDCDKAGTDSGSGNKQARVALKSPVGDADKVLVQEEDGDKQKKKKEQQQLQQQQSPQSSNASSAYQADCVKDPLNEPISSLPFDYDEEEEEMTLNLLLQLYGDGQEHMKVAGEPHYLPVRWRHMMMGTSAGAQGRPPLPPPSSLSRAAVDSDHRLRMLDETSSLFSKKSIRTVRSAATDAGRQQQPQLSQQHFGGDGASTRHRDTASIKSIIYARDLRPLASSLLWQPVKPIPPPSLPLQLRAQPILNSHASIKSSIIPSDFLQQRLLAILSIRSCRGTIRIYELEHLVRAAISATPTTTDSSSISTVQLSKQVVAAHFVALLRMGPNVRLRQKAAGGRRRPGLRLADFSSAVHKIYVSLVVQETGEKEKDEEEVEKPLSDCHPHSEETSSL